MRCSDRLFGGIRPGPQEWGRPENECLASGDGAVRFAGGISLWFLWGSRQGDRTAEIGRFQMHGIEKNKSAGFLTGAHQAFNPELPVLVQLFCDATRKLTDPTQMLAELEQWKNRLGINDVFSAFIPGRGEKLTDHIRFRGWNTVWWDHYDEENFVHGDPVVRHARNSFLPFVWSETFSPKKLGKIEQGILSEAKTAGFVDGYTVPIFGPRMKTAFVTFGISGRLPVGYQRDALDTIARRLHEWLMTNTRVEACKAADMIPLAPQEIEIIYHLMKGKRNKEIAHITGLSKRTVEAHAESAREKLKASNSLQAVVRALMLGFIHLE